MRENIRFLVFWARLTSLRMMFPSCQILKPDVGLVVLEAEGWELLLELEKNQ
jgi:hypothetical protein